MKKIFIIIAAVTFMAYNCSAQEIRRDISGRMMFGIKAGVNYSNVYSTKGEEFIADSKFGMVGGAFLSIPIGKFIGIQPEVLYSQKGFQATGIILGSTYQLTRTTSYIDIPLFFSLKLTEFLSLHAGPQYSYLVKQNDVFTSAITSIDQETEFKNDNIRKNIMSFVIGGDINLKHIVLGARAGWDVLKNNGNGTSTTPSYKNAWYQATIGFRIY